MPPDNQHSQTNLNVAPTTECNVVFISPFQGLKNILILYTQAFAFASARAFK